MVPTLTGRIQTRIAVLAVVGGLVTLVVTPLLPGAVEYRSAYIVLVSVIVLGIGWELAYHGLQQFRWEKDWPTLFGLATALNEGLLLWILLGLGAVPGIDHRPSAAAFVVQFGLVWVTSWLWVNGPMRVPFIRWRFHGGSLVGGTRG